MSVTRVVPRANLEFYVKEGDKAFEYVKRRLDEDTLEVFREGYFDSISRLYGKKSPRQMFYALKIAEYGAKSSKRGFLKYLNDCLELMRRGANPSCLYECFTCTEDDGGKSIKKCIEQARKGLEARLLDQTQSGVHGREHDHLVTNYKEEGNGRGRHSPEMKEILRKDSHEAAEAKVGAHPARGIGSWLEIKRK